MGKHVPPYPRLKARPTPARVRDWRLELKWWRYRRIDTKDRAAINTAINLAAGRGPRPYSITNIDMYDWPGWETIIGPEPPLEGLQMAWDSAHPEDRPDRPTSSRGKTLRFLVLERDGFRCRYCGRAAPDVVLHVDHVHPRSKGGTNDMGNLVTACRDCNLGKRDMVISSEQAS